MIEYIEKCTRVVWYIEKALWGDDVHSNPCFATAVLALSLLMGAMLGTTGWVLELLPFLAGLDMLPSLGVLVILSGFVVCESVCVANGFEVIVLRTLLVLFLAFAAFFVAYKVAGAALLLAVAWLFLLLVDLLYHLFK